MSLKLVRRLGVVVGAAALALPLAGPATAGTAGTTITAERAEARAAHNAAASRSAQTGATTDATAAAAAADSCTHPDGSAATCPSIVSVTVGNTWVRSSTETSILYPVKVVVDDPDDLARIVDTYMGRNLDDPDPYAWLVVGLSERSTPVVEDAAQPQRKTFTMTVDSPYLPYRYRDAPAIPAAFGGFQINPVVWGSAVDDPVGEYSAFLTQTYLSGKILARSVATNSPSATTVRRGQQFTVRGTLKRFDGQAVRGEKVNVYYVPAGQTRASYAGAATTTSTGTFALPVRAYYTGSWFVSYPGSAFNTSTYKGAWVRVS